MNFYSFYAGDYQRDTNRLTWTEDLAYRRLLDEYYSTEEPLPLDHEELYLATRAFSDEQKAAVDKVLRRFFHKEDDCYRNKKADLLIAEYQRRKANARKAAYARHHADADAPASPTASAPAVRDAMLPNPNPNPNPNPKAKAKAKAGKEDTVVPAPAGTRAQQRPQSVQEVEDYMLLKGVDPQTAQREAQQFWDHYESNGWKVGRNPMKKWKAAASGWLSRAETHRRPNGGGPSHNRAALDQALAQEDERRQNDG